MFCVNYRRLENLFKNKSDSIPFCSEGKGGRAGVTGSRFWRGEGGPRHLVEAEPGEGGICEEFQLQGCFFFYDGCLCWMVFPSVRQLKKCER